MIGDDGRVRVMDFGLVRTDDRDESSETSTLGDAGEASGSDALAVPLTLVGSVVGTPAYMSPEQLRGESVTALSDQYSFCVALYEALYRQRPFPDGSLSERLRAVTDGVIRPAPRGVDVPSWLRAIVLRGLAARPEARHPHMAELLAALASGDARRRRSRIVAGVAALALLGAGAVGHRRLDVARRTAACTAAGDEIDGVWNEAVRGRVRAAFAATGVGYADATFEKLTPWLDRQGEAWRRARTDACMEAEVLGTWDADTLDRASWCLDERRMAMETLLEEFARADATTVQRAVPAVARFGTLASCVDEDLLKRQPAPPREREAIREVLVELSRAESLELAGKFKEGGELVTQASARARELAWPPLVATAELRQGQLLAQNGEYAEAERALMDAYFSAARAGAWEVAAKAADGVIFYAQAARRNTDGRVWARLAELAASHAGDPLGVLEAGRLNALARWLFSVDGTEKETVEACERAVALYERALVPGHPSVATALNNLASYHKRMADTAGALALYERALAIHEETLGPDHPSVATTLGNLSNLHRDLGDLAAARATGERALAIRERTLGREHPVVAANLVNLVLVRLADGDQAGALEAGERALAIFTATQGSEDSLCLTHLAQVRLAMGEREAARALAQRAVDIVQKLDGPTGKRLGRGLWVLAEIEHAGGDLTKARELAERALAIQESVASQDTLLIAEMLVLLSSVALEQQRTAAARELVERAMTIYTERSGEQPGEPRARFQLARVLDALGSDPARALAEAEAARDGYGRAGADHAAKVAEIAAWIAARLGTGADGGPSPAK